MLSPDFIDLTEKKTPAEIENSSTRNTSTSVLSDNSLPAQTSKTPFTATGALAPSRSPTPSPFATSTPSPVPTMTSLPTSTPSPIPSQARSPVSTSDSGPFDEFVGAVFGEAEVDAATPIRVRAWTIPEGNSLIVVLNLTSETKNDLKRARAINTLVTSGYSQAVAYHDTGKIGGKMTDRLRIAEINNSGAPPKTLYVNTSLSREYYTGQISIAKFTEEYWGTERNMSAEEIDFVDRLDNGTEDVILYNRTAE